MPAESPSKPAARFRPTPDRDSREWWERVATGEFAVQECDGCGLRRFPARAFCARCRGEGRHWVAVRPVGTVESWVVSHRPFGQGEIVVMVRLDEVPDAVVHGSWEGSGEPEGGSRVSAVFTVVDDTLTLVGWRTIKE
ncbi:Zn-ribbon domain-containing OB-fold protein [Nonomuraea sp. NPDC050394]|uniref:Zn-ribbon domain-containing OB-fold protein n=1 Tax=Nonomuraea sp. NPDC050394 TaxID=3364363 RepID=UPI003799958B